MRNTADAPVYEVGDTWTFASYCDLAYLNRAFSSDPVLLKKAVDRNCNPSTLQILNVGDYAHLKVRDTSNSGRDYSESNYEHWGFMGVLKFPDTKDSTQVPQSEKYPMKPGDVWQKSENIGSVSNITRVSRASGWETIRVPAGEFRAIKLVHESQTVFANDGAAFGHRRVEWYSPDAKVAVKVELNGVTRFELQSYHVK